jgi:putative ABC transport system substrate-binding protein
MSERGYEEGRNLIIEWSTFDGRDEGLAAQVADLIGSRPDVMVTSSNPPTLAAKAATSTIPIVFVSVSDPVGEGLVDSLARPGGNATGLSNLATGLAAKRLELLKDALPGVTRVAALWVEVMGRPNLQLQEVQAAAAALGIEVLALQVGNVGSIDSALEAAAKGQADALYLITNPLFAPTRAPQIYDFAIRHRLSVVSAFRQEVEAGGLMAYGPSLPDMFRRAAYYVDRILKGAKPADLPVEQPMTFDFVVNMKTARELGITFPHEILLQVTEVID